MNKKPEAAVWKKVARWIAIVALCWLLFVVAVFLVINVGRFIVTIGSEPGEILGELFGIGLVAWAGVWTLKRVWYWGKPLSIKS